jgi:hypothetical protein
MTRSAVESRADDMRSQFTRHARDRSTARNFPPMVAQIIMEYGEAIQVGDGVQSFGLTSRSMRQIKAYAGPHLAAEIDRYRSRNAYIVVANGKVVTVAFGRCNRFKGDKR